MDRTCHMISAKSFDQLCKDMLDIKRVHGGDDMYNDVHPHGARELSLPEYVADNQVYRGED